MLVTVSFSLPLAAGRSALRSENEAGRFDDFSLGLGNLSTLSFDVTSISTEVPDSGLSCLCV